jgi:hypothetical protein
MPLVSASGGLLSQNSGIRSPRSRETASFLYIEDQAWRVGQGIGAHGHFAFAKRG